MESSVGVPPWLAEQRAESRTWFDKRDAEWKAWSDERDAKWHAWSQERAADWKAWSDKRDAEWNAWFERHEAEQRGFFRELLEHNARINQDLIGGLQEFGARMAAEIADQRAQIQANTQAVLRALDRLGPEPT